MRPLLAATLGLASLGLVSAFAPGCKTPDPPAITGPWTDTFERTNLGGDYLATDEGAYTVKDGKLHVQNAYNHPLWLRKKLPADAVIELDVTSHSPAGDIKVEAWGDGESFDPDRGGYMATGYVFIMGGWNNSRSIIARRDEHAPDVKARSQPRVEVGRTYHWKIVRKGGRIDWFVDDMTTPFLTFEDPQPLTGAKHAYFGFNDWEAHVTFDNLSITPAP